MIVGHNSTECYLLENNAVFGIRNTTGNNLTAEQLEAIRNIFKCSEFSAEGGIAIKFKKFDIPSDIFQHIFSFLSVKDLCSCSRVCKFWKDNSDRPSLWSALYFRKKNIWPLPPVDISIKAAYQTRTLTRKYSLSSSFQVTSLMYEGEYLMIAGSTSNGSQSIEVYQPRTGQKAIVPLGHRAPITSMLLVHDTLLAISNREAIWYAVSGTDLQEKGNTNKLEDFTSYRFVTAHMNQGCKLALFAGEAVTHVALFDDAFTKIDRVYQLPSSQPLSTLKGLKLYYARVNTPLGSYDISSLDLMTGQDNTLGTIAYASSMTALEVDTRATEGDGWALCGFVDGAITRSLLSTPASVQFTGGTIMLCRQGEFTPVAPISTLILGGDCVVVSSPDETIFQNRYNPTQSAFSPIHSEDQQTRSANRRTFFTQSQQRCTVDNGEVTVQDYSFMIDDHAKAMMDSEELRPQKRRTWTTQS